MGLDVVEKDKQAWGRIAGFAFPSFPSSLGCLRALGGPRLRNAEPLPEITEPPTCRDATLLAVDHDHAITLAATKTGIR